MFDLVAAGDVMLDVHVPAPSAHARLHAAARVVAGGSAVNAAIAAAELGAHACVVGCVGDDAAGRTIRDELAAHGVEARLAIGVRTGTTVYIGDAVVADRGANAGFVPGPLPEARVALVSGYLDAIAFPGATGLRAVDLQGREHTLPQVDVVLGPRIDLDAYDAGVVCATLGAEGAVARRGDEIARARPAQVLEEPLPGDGDRFAAAFLLALADDRPLAECLEHACAFAASGAV